MKKGKTLIIGIVLAAVLISLVVFVFINGTAEKSDEEIRKMFNCDRVTADFRKTDIYCQNPELYRQHKDLGTAIK